MIKEEIARECLKALSYEDQLNLEYEIERQYKVEKGYDKMGFAWAYSDQDRETIRFRKKVEGEWILLLESISIILNLIKSNLPDDIKFPEKIMDNPRAKYWFSEGVEAYKELIRKELEG